MFWNWPPMKRVEPLAANACTSPSAVAANVVFEIRLPLLSSSAMCGRPTPSILLKLPPMMMCPAPSVAIVLTVLLATGVHVVTRLPAAVKAARFETVAVVVPLWLEAWVNLPPTYVTEPICMIAFTRPFTCHVGRGLVAIAAVADGTSASMATSAPSAATLIRAPMLPT
jgi:hypothetical protein